MVKVNLDRQDIFDEIEGEREYQDRTWGGPEADDKHNGLNDWVTYITRYSTKWFPGGFPPYSNLVLVRFRESMVKVAALAVAAIEQTDRELQRRNA